MGDDGIFRKQRQKASDKPVYEIELKPDDGLYPLPYLATQADGTPEVDLIASIEHKLSLGLLTGFVT